MNVFFSYTVRDGLVDLTGLRRIAKRLEEFSFPYIDLLEHRCGGHQPSVWSALSQADAFLLCITPRVFESPWVVLECAAALERGVPVYAASRSSWLSMEDASGIEQHLTMCCSERLRLSRWLLPAPAFPPILQMPRRTPQSLSLGLLGVATPI